MSFKKKQMEDTFKALQGGQSGRNEKANLGPEQMVQMHLFGDKVFLEADALITMFKVNSKKKVLTRAQQEIFDRVILALEKLKASGLNGMAKSQFQLDDVVQYIGGQDEVGKQIFELKLEEEYTVSAVCKGKFGDEWHPAVYLKEADAKVAFHTGLFKFLRSGSE